MKLNYLGLGFCHMHLAVGSVSHSVQFVLCRLPAPCFLAHILPPKATLGQSFLNARRYSVQYSDSGNEQGILSLLELFIISPW